MQPELQETRVLLPPPVTPSDEEPIAAGGRQSKYAECWEAKANHKRVLKGALAK